ncbi:MAG: ABC transporter permease [Chloroflexi bacterium]|nr:ABC transporter permease [Chloroflexota bacterium]
MAPFIVNRLVQTIPILFLGTVLAFLVLRLIPGDPALVIAGEEATAEDLYAIREQLGLHDSWPEQYIRWLGDLVSGDLGYSFTSGLSVNRLFTINFPPTIELGIAAYAFAILVGIPLGILGGVKPRSFWDWLLSGYTMVAVGVPSFVFGIILLWIFAAELGWFPSHGRVSFLDNPVDSLHHLALPVIALAMPISAVLARYTRTTITDVVGQDFVRTARSKGLGESTVIVRHALRNSLIPVITIMALQVGELLTGVVIIEAVFTRPGFGRVVVEAIQRLDYLVVQTVLVVLVVIFVTVNLLADIIYGFVDPRVRVR